MFTGIIEAVGAVAGIEAGLRRAGAAPSAHRLDVDLGELATGLPLGASVAVNGVCLTLARLAGRVGGFDVVPETWQRTNLGRLRPGDPVNLERSLRAGDRIEGHFVQGHVEGVGALLRVDRTGGAWKLWVRAAPELLPAIVPKGAIALDGVSLTVVDVRDGSFSVALVPTTLARTVLGRRQAGDLLNIETDILARLVARQLARLHGPPAAGEPAGTTLAKLAEGGFL